MFLEYKYFFKDNPIRLSKLKFSELLKTTHKDIFLRKWKSLSHVWLFAPPWTVAHQAPLSMDIPGKNTGVGSHSLHQEIFPSQGSNLGLLHYKQILYYLSHQESS